MKDFVIACIVSAILILVFSTVCFPEDILPSLGGFGSQHPGDSGMVLPGKGAKPAEVIMQSEANGTDECEPPGVTNEIKKDIQTENVKEEQEYMGDMMLVFWHGVAAVLLGETAALMVATAWMKIKGCK